MPIKRAWYTYFFTFISVYMGLADQPMERAITLDCSFRFRFNEVEIETPEYELHVKTETAIELI